MKMTQFKFFKNTPLIDFQNTIHFNSNNERDAFFLDGSPFLELNIEVNNFNFIRDRSTVHIDTSYSSMLGVNYCTFLSDFENVRYYAYVINYQYHNDHDIEVNLLIDGIMTFTQGNILETLPNLDIKRQHLSLDNYNNRIWELKNNDDIIKTKTKSYFHDEEILFKDLVVLIQSAVELKGDFGSSDKPNMKTSSGKQFDKVTSPLNLYICNIDDFNSLMKKLSDFPWISQNIKSMSLIPKIFMQDNMTLIDFTEDDSLSGVTYLYTVSGTMTYKETLNTELDAKSKSMAQLYELFELDSVQDQHLLRNEYTTTELYNYTGGMLLIDNGQLYPGEGLRIKTDIVTGHTNEMKVYINKYRVESGLSEGVYLNETLNFNQFDDIPMLIDTYGLALSKSANQRNLAESKLVTKRMESIVSPDADIKDRFFNAASIASNFSPGNLFGKFTDEHEFYRTQKAEFADMALEPDSMTSQSNGNSFNIANDKFGIHFKYSKPSASEMNKIKKYYKMFGFQINDSSNKLDKINSMTICNYIQFSGSWTLPGTDVSIIEMMKAQFENGVRLWHHNGTANPMDQNVLNNKMKVI